jgi:hypothetical protein
LQVPTHDEIVDCPGAAVLYQDARWPWSGRMFYGVFFYLLWILGLVGSLTSGSPGEVLVVVVILALPIALCEWRMRKMGLVITDEGIELVRALSRTPVPWENIDGFIARRVVGLVDYGERKLWVTCTKGRMIPVPTIVLTPEKPWWRWWFSRARLKWSGGEIADVVGFLYDELATHHSSTFAGSERNRSGSRSKPASAQRPASTRA